MEVEAGGVGYGLTVLKGENLKTAVIREHYQNEWSSTHTIRMYNECPKKFAQY